MAIGIIGAIITCVKPFGMARVLLAMVIVQALIAAIAMVAKLGLPCSGPMEILLLYAFFVAAFLVATMLFCQAAGGQKG